MQIRFDGPPGHESGRFVEVEDDFGRGINAGTWREDGQFWLLKIQPPVASSLKPEQVAEVRSLLDNPTRTPVIVLTRDTVEALLAAAEENARLQTELCRIADRGCDAVYEDPCAEVIAAGAQLEESDVCSPCIAALAIPDGNQ